MAASLLQLRFARDVRFETARFVTATGVSPASAVMEICKTGDSCPLMCPPAYSLTRGAVYTVGETLHLRISPEITVSDNYDALAIAILSKFKNRLVVDNLLS